MVFTYERNVKRCEYPKDDCENYLFEDYCLKSGVAIWIPALRTSAYYKEVERDMVISIC